MKIVFASNNENKLKELRNILKSMHNDDVEILSLKDMNIQIEVEENMSTLEENAIKKAREIYEALEKSEEVYPVIAEDFGFFVEELPKIAGVHSNRWLEGTDEDRNNEVIKKMKDIENRKCYYKSVFALYDGKVERVFGGYTYGNVAKELRGVNGFAYDSIFEIEMGRTIAELEPEEKDEISSRREAFEALISAIQNDNNF